MKPDGSDGSDVSAVGVTVPGVCDSHLGTQYDPSLDWRLAITPERMATPIVPHPIHCVRSTTLGRLGGVPITQSVYPMVPVVDGGDEYMETFDDHLIFTRSSCVADLLGMLVFVTVGSTRFDALVQAVLSEEVLDVLHKKGYSQIVLQRGDSTLGRGDGTMTLGKSDIEVETWTFKPSIEMDIRRASLVISHAGHLVQLEFTTEVLMMILA